MMWYGNVKRIQWIQEEEDNQGQDGEQVDEEMESSENEKIDKSGEHD